MNPSQFVAFANVNANRNVRKDGAVIWCEWYDSAIYDDKGELASVLSLVLDITERRRAEDELRRSEETFRTVIENVSDAVNMLDLKTGRYVVMSPSQVELTGFTAEEINNISAEEAAERVHPDDREISAAQQRLLVEGIDTPDTTVYRWKVKSGEYRWFADRRRLVRDANGKPVALVGISRDVTEERRRAADLEFIASLTLDLVRLSSAAEIVQAVSEQMAEHLGASQCLIAEVDNTGDRSVVTYRLLGSDAVVAESEPFVMSRSMTDEFRVAARSGRSVVIPDMDAERRLDEDRAAAVGVRAAIAVPFQHADEWKYLFVVNDSKPREWSDDEIRLVEEVANRVIPRVERAIAEEALRESLARTTVLSDLAAAAASSLDPAELTDRALARVREHLGADIGAIYLLRDPAGPARVSAHFGYPIDAEGIDSVPLDDTTLAGRAMLTGKTQVAGDEPPPPGTNERMKVTGTVGHRFALCPIIARDVVIGTFAVGFPGLRAFTEAEIDLYEAIAGQLAVALENARLYEAEHGIAETLQETLVVVPSHIPGVAFSRAYESATAELGRVGGDFVDIFEIHGNNVGIVVGDVSGKGIDAAVITSLVRNTVRAHAVDGAATGEICRKTNTVMRRFTEVDAYVTMFLGLLNTKTGLLRYVSAGHPPGILCADTVDCQQLMGAKDPILGAFDEVTFHESQTVMRNGEKLVLYTDGVTEARSPGVGGFYRAEGLERSLCANAHADATQLAQVLMDDVLLFSDGVLRDDAAILVVEPTRIHPLHLDQPQLDLE